MLIIYGFSFSKGFPLYTSYFIKLRIAQFGHLMVIPGRRIIFEQISHIYYVLEDGF